MHDGKHETVIRIVREEPLTSRDSEGTLNEQGQRVALVLQSLCTLGRPKGLW